MLIGRFAAYARCLVALALIISAGACADVEVKTDFDKIHLGKDAIDVQTLSIALDPQNPANEHVGALQYRGGLFLKSRDKRFGGLSGMIISDDGKRLLAISDEGYWFGAQLSYNKGRLADLSKAELAPILDESGSAFISKGKGEADAEGLGAAGPEGLGGEVYVSFERHHRILLYPFGKDGFAARANNGSVEVPSDLSRLSTNSGIEGLVHLDANTLFTIAENVRNREGNLTGWLIPVPAMVGKGGYGALSLKAIRDFNVTDMALLPDGDVLVLERSFSLERGAGMQLRRIARADIKPGAILTGQVLANLDVSFSIDNMEALAVRKNELGETLVYVLSDDNYNGLQRTVLLMFALTPFGGTPAPAAQ